MKDSIFCIPCSVARISCDMYKAVGLSWFFEYISLELAYCQIQKIKFTSKVTLILGCLPFGWYWKSDSISIDPRQTRSCSTSLFAEIFIVVNVYFCKKWGSMGTHTKAFSLHVQAVLELRKVCCTIKPRYSRIKLIWIEINSRRRIVPYIRSVWKLETSAKAINLQLQGFKENNVPKHYKDGY